MDENPFPDDPAQALRQELPKLFALSGKQTYDQLPFIGLLRDHGFRDISQAEELKRLATTTTNRDAHEIAVRHLGALVAATGDANAKRFLIDRYKSASKLWIREQIGSVIDDPAFSDVLVELAPLMRMLQGTALMYLLKAFKHCRRPEAEDAVLEALARPEQKHDTWFALMTLREIGTKRSLDALRKHFGSRIQDVASGSLAVFAKIAGPAGCSLYHEVLDGKAYLCKGTAGLAIATHCGSAGVPALIGRIKSITTKPRQETDFNNQGTEFTALMEAVIAHRADHAKAAEKLLKLLDERFERLAKSERRWMVAHVSEFANRQIEPPPKPVETLKLDVPPDPNDPDRKVLGAVHSILQRALRWRRNDGGGDSSNN